jgi:hypothetical protein
MSAKVSMKSKLLNVLLLTMTSAIWGMAFFWGLALTGFYALYRKKYPSNSYFDLLTIAAVTSFCLSILFYTVLGSQEEYIKRSLDESVGKSYKVHSAPVTK